MFLQRNQEKTSQVFDGGNLMNRAFSCANQTPVIAFNQLQSLEDRDEQQGMMNLFKGIVGIKNKKAHMNVTLDNSGCFKILCYYETRAEEECLILESRLEEVKIVDALQQWRGMHYSLGLIPFNVE